MTTATITLIPEFHAYITFPGGMSWGLAVPDTHAELFAAADQTLTRNGWARTGPGWVQDFGGVTGATYVCEVAPISTSTESKPLPQGASNAGI
jgi:hypothetical protein